MRHSLLMVPGAVALVVSCGDSPSAPTAPTGTGPTVAVADISGRVVATNGGAPLGGVAIEAADTAVTTSDAGAFSVSLSRSGGSTVPFRLTGASILPRTLYVARRPQTLTLDAISVQDGTFDQAFYRQFVRNAYDDPATLQPLRRWARAPMIYLKTVDEAGVEIPLSLLDATEAAIRETAPLFTGERFGVAVVQRGTETREGQGGWITVNWIPENEGNFCGRAGVAVEGGRIQFNYKAGSGCSCGSLAIRPRTVRHELGHALGFWHTDSRNDVMFGTLSGCDQMPSARERYHAAVAYARPIGNTDPDDDPAGSFVTLRPAIVID